MSATSEFAHELSRRLSDLARDGLLRSLAPGTGLDLTSNDTLGLAGHARLRERMRDALRSGPAGAGAARLLGGEHDVFARLETRLARFCQSESALLFPTGYAANSGLVQALAGADDFVLSDARNHASLIDGLRLSRARKLVYPHGDAGAVAAALADWSKARGNGRAFVLTESLFGMDGDLAPLRELADACERHGALLVVDEAHATGLHGAHGSGLVEELGLRARVLCSVHTGGKALGAAGAWVAGPASLRDWLINRARPFVFSTAPMPVLAVALDAALDVLRDEPWRRDELRRKVNLLRAALAWHGVPCVGSAQSAVVPVIVGDNEAAVDWQRALQAQGFDVRAVRPPTVPAGSARLRVCVRVPVADDDLRRLAAALGGLWSTRATVADAQAARP